MLHEAYRDFTKLPPLTDAEKKSPYAPLYDVPVELPEPKIVEAIQVGKQMDPSKALAITDMKKLFAPGYLECENGYCTMPDGIGYSCINVKMPAITPPVFTNFFRYTHSGDLEYKTWMPKMHIQMGAFTIEDVGWGPFVAHLQKGIKHSPETLGIDNPKAFDPAFIQFFGGSSYAIDLLTGERTDFTMVNYIRQYENGIEFRIRVWYGLWMKDGEAVRMIPEGEVFPVDKVLAMATHNAFEWHRVNTIARQVFEIGQPDYEK